MIFARRLGPALAVAVAAMVPVRAAGQRADTLASVHPVLERFDRRTTVRLHVPGRSLSGQVTRLTDDSVYVQGFDWPVAVSLARVDSVWERLPGERHWKVPALVGAGAGAVLFAYGAWGLCGYSDSYPPPNCTLAPVGGAIVGAVLVGSVGAFLGGLVSRPAQWERRFP